MCGSACVSICGTPTQYANVHNSACLRSAKYKCVIICECVWLNVNGTVYWVNRSVHGYKGHEYVYIIKCVCVCVREREGETVWVCVEQRHGVSKLHQPKGENMWEVVCRLRTIMQFVSAATLFLWLSQQPWRSPRWPWEHNAFVFQLAWFFFFSFYFKYNAEYNPLSEEMHIIL